MSAKNKTPLLVYYYDAACQQMLPRDALGNFKVTFSSNEPPPIAGQTSIRTSFYVRNEHHYPIELKPLTSDPDLSISEYPDFLEPQESAKVTLTFSPAEDRIKPLEGGCWDFTKVVHPKTIA